jgi:hypothetical protein
MIGVVRNQIRLAAPHGQPEQVMPARLQRCRLLCTLMSVKSAAAVTAWPRGKCDGDRNGHRSKRSIVDDYLEQRPIRALPV